MVRIHPKPYPPDTIKKLHARSVRLFKSLKKINSNAYIVDLPPDFGIGPPFYIEDLIAYKSPNFLPIIIYWMRMSLPMSPFLRETYYLHFSKYNPPIRQNKLIIRFSLLEMMVTTYFQFVGKDLILKTPGLIGRSSNSWIRTVQSTMRAEEARIRQS